jgi:hypothetical protein
MTKMILACGVAAFSLTLAACGSKEEAEAAPAAAPAPAPAAAPAPSAPAAAPAPVAAPATKYRRPTVDEIAGGANANCDIAVDGLNEEYSGPCKFDSFGGASFSVERADGYPMVTGIEMFVLEADTRTVARMTARGDDVLDMGIAERPNTSDACWTAPGARVCAYAAKFK